MRCDPRKFLLVLICIPLSLTFANTMDPAFEDLVARLISDGRDSTTLRELFQNDRVSFIDELVPRNMLPRDNRAVYESFLTDSQILDGVRFYTEWGSELKSLLAGTNIPPEVVIAILKIESNFGRRSGDQPVFTTFATIAAMNHPQYWAHFADTSAILDMEYLEKRARNRSNWAYKELNALIDLYQSQGWDVLGIKGSWAGAFGWAQFLPTSFVYYSRDGDGDQRIDPLNFYDAVASLANYLKQARWNTSRQSQRKALHRYNPSQAYVECVLDYSERLRSYLQSETKTAP